MTQPRERPRSLWRLRLARRIYPWWTEAEIDAARHRGHERRKALGLVYCVEVDDLDFRVCCDTRWNYATNEWDHQPGCLRCAQCNGTGRHMPEQDQAHG